MLPNVPICVMGSGRQWLALYFCRASGKVKIRFIGKYCANFLFLDNICCYLQNALIVSFKLNRRAVSWLLEELGSPPIRVTADTAIVVSFTMTIKADGYKAKLSMDDMWWHRMVTAVFRSLFCFGTLKFVLLNWNEVLILIHNFTVCQVPLHLPLFHCIKLLTEVSYSDSGVHQHLTSQLSQLKEKYFRNPFRRKDFHKAKRSKGLVYTSLLLFLNKVLKWSTFRIPVCRTPDKARKWLKKLQG